MPEHRQPIARLIGFALVHFCSSVTLARVERTIIEEVVSRRHHARAGLPSPAQWMERLIAYWRTVEAWKWEGK